MRYLDRMRTGVALGALLLCLTSTTLTLSPGARVSAAEPVPTLGSVCHLSLEAEGSVQLFRNLGDRWPVAVRRWSDGDAFQALMRAMGDAPQVQVRTGSREIAGVLVLYGRTGRADRVLELTRDGLLFDPAGKQYFRAGDEVLRFAEPVMADRSATAAPVLPPPAM
ncbi:hypothetical protein [Alicyclobacillus sp.]|uniref:hypothetical protein n=1 Tax=Alicyclobacillus sp. TaxID=61169 RepID=UPI0025B885D8|nr:hypothetical protein [Alicyclobacillus sp.]MCL6515469.1 hypothetical protein [Alicyclobacillus sp.]